MNLPVINNLTHAQLEQWVGELGQPRFRADQLFRWLHARGVSDFAAMTDISAVVRRQLADQARITMLQTVEVLEDQDGTTKLVLACPDGALIETVLIPMPTGMTQCLSSQVGCRMGCRFCLTGQRAWQRNLQPGEIVAQVQAAIRLFVARGKPGRPDKLVFMGMGEPLDNLDEVLAALDILLHPRGLHYSGRRVTVSTAGHIDGLARLAAQAKRLPVSLAVSLNATDDEQRRAVMPIARRYPLAALLDALRCYPLAPRRRMTIEYVLLGGWNDTLADARRLVALLHGIRCKVNLIPFNPWPGAVHVRPTPAAVEAFRERLSRSRLVATVRESKGQGVLAACGLLGACAHGDDHDTLQKGGSLGLDPADLPVAVGHPSLR